MRKEVYAPKWFLDICDESKNMTQGFLYLMLEMEKRKKRGPNEEGLESDTDKEFGGDEGGEMYMDEEEKE